MITRKQHHRPLTHDALVRALAMGRACRADLIDALVREGYTRDAARIRVRRAANVAQYA